MYIPGHMPPAGGLPGKPLCLFAVSVSSSVKWGGWKHQGKPPAQCPEKKPHKQRILASVSPRPFLSASARQCGLVVETQEMIVELLDMPISFSLSLSFYVWGPKLRTPKLATIEPSSYFIDEDTKKQRGTGTCPGPHSLSAAGPGWGDLLPPLPRALSSKPPRSLLSNSLLS